MMRRRLLKKKKFTRKKEDRVKFVKRASVVLLSLSLVAVVVFLGYSYFYDEDRFVKEVVIEGNTMVSSLQIEEAVQTELQKKEYVVLPKQHKLLVNEEEVKLKIEENIPEIESAEVARVNKTLHVTVEEREPETLWCDMDTSNGSICVFVDKTSLAFKEASIALEGVYVTFITENRKVHVGEMMFTQSEYENINHFASEAASRLSSEPRKIVINKDDDVSIILENNITVHLTLTRLTQNVLHDLDLVREELTEVFSPENLHKLEYVDLRFEDKVLYKQKGEKSDETEPTIPSEQQD